MSQLPFFSIIIPTYNRKELLRKALLSIVSQESKEEFFFEIIVVDDGSTDGTDLMIWDFQKEYAVDIHYFFQENSGVGKARNTWIANIHPESTYTIFLDSDDEFKPDLLHSILKEYADLGERWLSEKTLGLYFLCEDEVWQVMDGNIIYDVHQEKVFTYDSFLHWEVNFAMMQVLRSSFFLQNPNIRFAEDVINETVMFVQMWQYMKKNNLQIVLWRYIGYVYRQEHHEFRKITHTLSQDRFKKNAIGNERVLSYIKEDLIAKWYFHIYADYLFRIGINWVLAWEKQKGIQYLEDSLKYRKSLKTLWIYMIAYLHRRYLLFIYTLYVH